jgi:hypothetical protein
MYVRADVIVTAVSMPRHEHFGKGKGAKFQISVALQSMPSFFCDVTQRRLAVGTVRNVGNQLPTYSA